MKHFVARGKTKAAIAERFNLTIQRLIYKICRYANSNNWISDQILGKAKSIYLNRKHRTIQMSPLEAEKDSNQSKLKKTYLKKYRKADEHRKKPKFKTGDTVRISALSTPFERGYHQNFTTEVWTVSKVMDNLPQPRYIVKDELGEELENVLNENELVAYQPSGVYEIERVLKTRKRRGKMEALVSWLHYDDRFNSWIPYDEIKDL